MLDLFVVVAVDSQAASPTTSTRQHRHIRKADSFDLIHSHLQTVLGYVVTIEADQNGIFDSAKL
ncbi:hypothetical protein D3C80_2188840 [compost metagenome]